MVKEVEACVKQNSPDAVCPAIRAVSALLIANYTNYETVGTQHPNTWKNEWGCTGKPVAITEQLFLAHLYGWIRSSKTVRIPEPTSFTTRPATTIQKNR